MTSKDFVLSLLPLVPPCILIIPLLENPLIAFSGPPTFTSQILAYIALAVLGFFLTNRLVPHIKVRATITLSRVCVCDTEGDTDYSLPICIGLYPESRNFRPGFGEKGYCDGG